MALSISLKTSKHFVRLAVQPKPRPSQARRHSVVRCQQVSVDELHSNWKNKYLATRRDGSKYVKYNLAGDSQPSNAVTTSEAIGYGMLITVLRGEKPEFDGLMKFYQSFINPNHGMMKWQILDNFTAPDSNSATDGDMDVAYALFKAEKKWGGGSYKQQALSICQSLLTHCIKSGESHMPMVGSWAGPTDNRVLSRSSDWMPAHFLLFKTEDSAHADKWQATFDKTVAAYERNRTQHPRGLLADFHVYDESAKVYNASTGFVLENSHDKDYFTNASRIPWRLATFWKAHGEQAVRDAGLYPAMKALKKFFESEIVSTGEVKGGYYLDGSRMNEWTNNAYMGPAWCLLKVMGSSKADDLEQKVLEHVNDRYFADSILLMSILETQ